MNLPDTEAPAEYADIFIKRGHLYHEAMRLAPQARDLEFSQLFFREPCRPSERILDVPSGGAYLQSFLKRTLPDHQLEIANLEFTPGFSERPLVVDPYGSWPIDLCWADRAICLAASHHIVNLSGLLENFYRHTRPGALIQLADAGPGGGVAGFLDTFVHQHTSTGHRGIYRSFESFEWPSWVELCCIESRPCHWRFDSEAQMLQFCLQLFGLDESARPRLRAALDAFIGIDAGAHGVLLKWELVYVDARRK